MFHRPPPHAPPPERIVITGAGIVCPAGRDAILATAAIRAGITRYRVLRDLATRSGRRIVGSPALGVTDGKRGPERLQVLAAPALREALIRAGGTGPTDSTCDGPPARATAVGARSTEASGRVAPPDFLRARLLLALAPGAALPDGFFADAGFAHTETTLFAGGHAAALSALVTAHFVLRAGKATVCVVGGVDSLLDPPALEALLRSRRLHSESQPEGIVPGEAAAFLVLETESGARARGATEMATVAGAHLSDEEDDPHEGRPLTGRGLHEALKRAFDIADAHAPGATAASSASPAALITDLGGEAWRAREWGLASARLGARAAARIAWRPAGSIGDTGAAAGAVGLVMAAAALASDWCDPGLAIVCGSESGGTRGCALLAPAAAESRVREKGLRAVREPFPEVVEEHREEAAYLLARRAAFPDDPRASFESLARLEARLIPHLDALALSGAPDPVGAADADGSPDSPAAAGPPIPPATSDGVEALEDLDPAAGAVAWRALLERTAESGTVPGWHFPLLAVAGSEVDLARIEEAYRRDPQAKVDALRALGLAGSARAVKSLLAALDELAGAAASDDWIERSSDHRALEATAAALALATGRDIPLPDPEDAGPEAIAAFRNGWVEWWESHRERLAAAVLAPASPAPISGSSPSGAGGRSAGFPRLRRGQPITPAVLARDLARPNNPFRRWTEIELRLRHGCPVRLRWTDPAAVQARRAAEIQSWADALPATANGG